MDSTFMEDVIKRGIRLEKRIEALNERPTTSIQSMYAKFKKANSELARNRAKVLIPILEAQIRKLRAEVE